MKVLEVRLSLALPPSSQFQTSPFFSVEIHVPRWTFCWHSTVRTGVDQFPCRANYAQKLFMELLILGILTISNGLQSSPTVYLHVQRDCVESAWNWDSEDMVA